MGISEFMPLFKAKSPGCVYDSGPQKFRNQKMIAVDISIWCHSKFRQILPGFVQSREDESSSDDDSEDCDEEIWFIDWQGFQRRWFSQILDIGWSLLQEKITPVFVFDGKAPKIKKDTHIERENARKRLEENLITARKAYFDSLGKFQRNEAREKYRKAFIGATRFKFSLMDDLKKLLLSIGFPVLQSVEETDFLIAALSKEGLISAAFSTDTDLCIYGIDYLLTNYYQNQFTILDRKVLLEESGLDDDQLVDLAILLSCDYNTRMPGVGKKTAFNLIEKFGKLEMIPAKYIQKPLRRTIIRNRFKNIPSWKTLVDYRSSSIQDPDIDLLVFSKKNFLKNGFKTLQKYDLVNRWEDTLELVKEKI